MNKILIAIIASIGISLPIKAQQNQTFTFVKSSVERLQKQAKYDDYGTNLETPFVKKRMLGMFLINDATQQVDYESKKYISFLSIPTTEKFEIVIDLDSSVENWKKDIVIKNSKTNQMYAVMLFPVKCNQDHSNMGNENNGFGWLIKYTPKELTKEKLLLVAKYKALIKSANANITVLVTIQRRHLTNSGYFDETRVNAVDKKSYNKNLDALKIKAKQLQEIDQWEDKDDLAQDKLTISEIGMLSNINDWNMHQNKIN